MFQTLLQCVVSNKTQTLWLCLYKSILYVHSMVGSGNKSRQQNISGPRETGSSPNSGAPVRSLFTRGVKAVFGTRSGRWRVGILSLPLSSSEISGLLCTLFLWSFNWPNNTFHMWSLWKACVRIIKPYEHWNLHVLQYMCACTCVCGGEGRDAGAHVEYTAGGLEVR